VGSSQGRIYAFDLDGKLREARIVGEGQVRVAMRHDGTLGAAWCNDALLLFHENKITNAAEAIDWPSGLTMFGDHVVMWRGNEVKLLDNRGRLIWCVEFSKSVTSIAAYGDTLVCAAGVLAGFRKIMS
jgi:hypothetical protein